MSQLFNLSLPKWPQLMLVGTPVTRDQALEIILRTDPFLYGDGCTNHREFQKNFYRQTGLDRGFVYEPGQTTDAGFFGRMSELMTGLESRLGRIELHYVVSEWTACSFLLGPHGFCSPKGDLFFQDNVGKWPDVEDVYQDFIRIAEAFPFLDFTASLYDGENCEADERPLNVVVSFVVKDGKVTISQEDFGLQQHRRPETYRSYRSLFSDRGEIGLPEDMLNEVIGRVRAATDHVLAHSPAID